MHSGSRRENEPSPDLAKRTSHEHSPDEVMSWVEVKRSHLSSVQSLMHTCAR